MGAKARKPSLSNDRIEVQNVNVPSHRSTVNAAKYNAMFAALQNAFIKENGPLTQKEMMAHVMPFLCRELFPGGAKCGWWIKTVQLDLEAKKQMARDSSKSPLRWRWVK